MNSKLILGLFLVVSLFVVSCADSGTTGYVIQNPIQKCYDVEVPYQVTEEYYEPFRYEVVGGGKTTTLRGFDVWALSEVQLKNFETESGRFTVKQTFETLNDNPQSFETSRYIGPGETVSFEELYDIDLGEDFSVTYSVTAPLRTLTRTVTEYRTEQRCD